MNNANGQFLRNSYLTPIIIKTSRTDQRIVVPLDSDTPRT